LLKQTVKVFCLLSVLGLGVLPALAQSRSSSADLTGMVSDPSRLPLRGASVTATNLGAGLARGVATEASGVYRIPLLPTGVYEVKIEINDFSTQILMRGQI
jgi:Carboxypeptidase regulatory-like domain